MHLLIQFIVVLVGCMLSHIVELQVLLKLNEKIKNLFTMNTELINSPIIKNHLIWSIYVINTAYQKCITDRAIINVFYLFVSNVWLLLHVYDIQDLFMHP